MSDEDIPKYTAAVKAMGVEIVDSIADLLKKVSLKETLEIIAFILAAEESKVNGGIPIRLRGIA